MKYKTITLGPGTKFHWGKSDHSWDWVCVDGDDARKDENGFVYTHELVKGTVIIKIPDAVEEEHQKENVIQNPTGKRMIQL